MFRSAPLAARHVVDGFRCGKEALDAWLIKHALASDEKRNSRTYVWTKASDARVVAYFSFAPHLIVRQQLPKRLGHGAPETVPAILLARLARHVDLGGERLGRDLLYNAFEVCLAAADLIGGRFLAVDAIDEEAARWYERRGFHRLASTPRLFLKMSAIEASVRK